MSAKEMFEKINYNLIYDDENIIIYEYITPKMKKSIKMRFSKVGKQFWKYHFLEERNVELAIGIEIEELQAINKQIEELG